MSRKAARFTEADVTRVLKAAKKAGMIARVDLCSGIIDVGADLVPMPPAGEAPPAERKRIDL